MEIEIGKMMADIFKFIATLSIGMIGFVLTMIEKVFTPRKILSSLVNIGFISVTMLVLIASLVLSILGLIEIPKNVTDMVNEVPGVQWVNKAYFIGSVILLLTGIFLFVIVSALSYIKDASTQNLLSEDLDNPNKPPEEDAEVIDSSGKGEEPMNTDEELVIS